jgi:hypothetical protein
MGINLSDLQIGHIRRLLGESLTFVVTPAPSAEPPVLRQWCQSFNGAESIREVAGRWAKRLKALAEYLFAIGLAKSFRDGRPANYHNLVFTDLNSCEEMAHAIICLAIDAAEGNEVFQRARQREQLETPVPCNEKKTAVKSVADSWQIAEILNSVLLVDPSTFQRFIGAMRSFVEDTVSAAQLKASQSTAVLEILLFESKVKQLEREENQLIAEECARRFVNTISCANNWRQHLTTPSVFPTKSDKRAESHAWMDSAAGPSGFWLWVSCCGNVIRQLQICNWWNVFRRVLTATPQPL